MAKLGFVFIAVFCLVQFTLAARLPRETETTTQSFLDIARDGLGKFQDGIQKTFTKENSEKLWKSVSEGASQLNDQIKELASDVQTKFADLTKEKPEQKN